MKLKVAQHAGFCMGVRRAVNMVLDEVHADSGPIYSMGPLIHNPQVVDFLRSQGVIDLSGKEVESGTVVIPSHGIRPQERERLKDKGLSFCDATCPRVEKVHGLIRKYQDQGYLVIILGDPGHAEVEGLRGEARGQAVVIQHPEQAAGLPDAEKVLLVEQTTQSQERFEQVAAAVRNRYAALDGEALRIEDTICHSTRLRQDEIREMAAEIDAIVVVGGKTSANTKRLAEISREQGVPSFLVENEGEIDWEKLKEFQNIGLTAGASTPNWVIRRVYEELAGKKREDRPRTLRWLYTALRSLVVSNVYISLGAVSMCLASGFLQGFMPRWPNLAVSFLYVFAMHTFNILVNREAVSINEPLRSRAFEKRRRIWIGLSLAALALAFGLCASIGLWSLVLFCLASIPGLLYQFRILRIRQYRLPYRSLREIPGSKDIFSALAWALVCVALPLINGTASQILLHRPTPATAAAFLMVLVLVFVRAVVQDFRDIQGDRMVGMETIPTLLGERRTRRLLAVVVSVLALLFLALYVVEHLPYLALWLLVPVAYAGLTISLFTRPTIVQGLRAESMVDLTFIIAGLVAIIDRII